MRAPCRRARRLGRLWLLLAAAALALSGCRTVWIHPEADRDRYLREYHRCRYGAEPPTPPEAPVEARSRAHWRDCMYARGWSRRVRWRFVDPYAPN